MGFTNVVPLFRKHIQNNNKSLDSIFEKLTRIYSTERHTAEENKILYSRRKVKQLDKTNRNFIKKIKT